MNKDESFLISLYSDIVNGFSKIKWKSHFIYIRHHGIPEMNLLNEYVKEYKEKYKKRGFQTEEELIADAIKRKDWNQADEEFISSQEARIEALSKAANKIQVPSHRERQYKFIDKIREEIRDKKTKRNSFIKNSLNNISYAMANNRFMENIIFLDKDFTLKISDSDDIDEDEFDFIIKSQLELYKEFSDDNISKLVLSDFFSHHRDFTKSSQDFFGKPFCETTIFQSKLLSYSNMFTRIFENVPDIPDFIRKDPEAVIEFAKHKRESEASGGHRKPTRHNHKNADASARTVFGANKDDLNKMAASDEKTIDLHSEIKKKGGKLNMQQMMELMGVEK